jgi:hypothetical protein
MITVPHEARDERQERVAAARRRIEQILTDAGWP